MGFKESFKERLQQRIEKNAIKVPNVSWTDKKGRIHTEDIIIKRSTLPLIGDWSRIYPPINEDGKINKINTIFGGKKNLIKLLIIMGLVAMILLTFKDLFNQYQVLKESCVLIHI